LTSFLTNIDSRSRITFVFVMTLAAFPELRKLSKKQRISLADELWQSGVSDSARVPAKQQKILTERWAAYKAGKVKRISMSELSKRLEMR
jgi:putative addiction module component (TIGR02574 family)